MAKDKGGMWTWGSEDSSQPVLMEGCTEGGVSQV